MASDLTTEDSWRKLAHEAISLIEGYSMVSVEELRRRRDALAAVPRLGTGEREGEVNRLCRALAGSWLYGGWRAETASEREQEAAMRALGFWPITEERLLDLPAHAAPDHGEDR